MLGMICCGHSVGWSMNEVKKNWEKVKGNKKKEGKKRTTKKEIKTEREKERIKEKWF